jgi:hypothetical protein
MRSAYWRIATINVRLDSKEDQFAWLLRRSVKTTRTTYGSESDFSYLLHWLEPPSSRPVSRCLLSDKCRFHCRHHQSFDVSSPRSFPYIVFNSYLRLYFPSRLYIGSKLKIPCKHKRTPNLPMVPDSSATAATPSRRIHIDCRHPIKF